MSILGPPTAMVPAPVFSRAKSLRAKMRNMCPYMSQMSTEQQHASRYIYSIVKWKVGVLTRPTPAETQASEVSCHEGPGAAFMSH